MAEESRPRPGELCLRGSRSELIRRRASACSSGTAWRCGRTSCSRAWSAGRRATSARVGDPDRLRQDAADQDPRRARRRGSARAPAPIRRTARARLVTLTERRPRSRARGPRRHQADGGRVSGRPQCRTGACAASPAGRAGRRTLRPRLFGGPLARLLSGGGPRCPFIRSTLESKEGLEWEFQQDARPHGRRVEGALGAWGAGRGIIVSVKQTERQHRRRLRSGPCLCVHGRGGARRRPALHRHLPPGRARDETSCRS